MKHKNTRKTQNTKHKTRKKKQVANFYRSREARCFLALEATRGSLFGLTRRASKERLCQASVAPRVKTGEGFDQARGPHASTVVTSGGTPVDGSGLERDAAGELEGK